MEQPKAFLKNFRSLSEEPSGDVEQEELREGLNNNGTTNIQQDPEVSRGSLSCIILPPEGENAPITTESVNLNLKETAEEEKNFAHLTEQIHRPANSLFCSEKCPPGANCDLPNIPDQQNQHVCSQSYQMLERRQDECTFGESPRPNCRPILIDRLSEGHDCLAQVSVLQPDAKTANLNVKNSSQTVQYEEDFLLNSSSEEFDTQESEGSESGSSNLAGEQERSLDALIDRLESGFTHLHTELQERPGLIENTTNIFSPYANCAHNPPPGSTLTRATFSPGAAADKHIQLPALFSGFRVLRKGIVGPEHDTVTHIKAPGHEARLSVFADKRGGSEVQGSFLNQISQLLSREKKGDEKEEKRKMEVEGDWDESKADGKEESLEGEGDELKTNGDAEVLELIESKRLSSAEAAFDAFKAFFTPKPLKKDPADKIDLEAVRKKMKADNEVLRTLFEKNSNKTPEREEPSDSQSGASTPGEGEDRTPGRLQAVWPPLKEEKVGLKYTEAEHQAALLQLKRECKEEIQKLQEDYSQRLSGLKLENDDNVARLEGAVAELQALFLQAGARSRGELRDISVSTDEDFAHRSFRTVAIQTDRETFIKTPEDGEGAGGPCNGPPQHKVTPKKLDLTSIGLNLTGQRDDAMTASSFSPSSTSTSAQTPAPLCALSPSQPPPTSSVTLTTVKPHAPSPPPPPPPPPPPCPPCPPLDLKRASNGFPCPPPPPPMSSSMPPPPPPPPAFGGYTVEKPPRKAAVKPSQPMKPLYWTRIQIQDNNNNTMWSLLEEPNIIDAGKFEDLFAKTTTQTKRKPLSEAYEKKSKAKKLIKLLDGKRSQAVGILISSLHLEMKDIEQAVLAVDHTVVDLETIEALYENRAQPEELERIKNHYETSEEDDVKLLDKPEQFLYELSQIPDFAGRARCIIFQSAFLDGVAAIQRKLNTVSSVSKALLESDSVREVMGLVLALGNHMNGGSRVRGQADGFGLEILPKLKDVKSRDNRISLVDFVVSYYLHNVDKNAGTDKSVFPLPEPQDVFLAAQVKLEDLSRDLNQLGRDLSKCEKDIQRVCAESPEEHLQPFKDKMEAFALSARKDHAEGSYQLTTTQKSFQDLVLYFGLKPRTGEREVTTGHFFMLWFEFCADFKARWKRENKTISKERLKEAQQSVKRITGEKKVETRKINANSLKERLRQKEATFSSA